MKDKPLFSVLIANYNNGKYLMDAIESVRKQTYTNWEIILVDDASTDNSQELYKEIAQDKRIHVFLNDKNYGIAYTKRKCIEKANGVYLAFLDPDDELLVNALSDHSLVYTKHDNISIIFSRHYVCDKDMLVLSESRKLQIDKEKSYFTQKDFRAEHMVSIKKSAYHNTIGIETHYRLAVDTNINFLMEEVGEIYCLDTICYKYRLNVKNQATADYSRHMFWNLLVQYDTCKRRGVDIEEQVYNWFNDAVAFLSKQQVYNVETSVRNSMAYKLGATLLKPIKFMKSILKK